MRLLLFVVIFSISFGASVGQSLLQKDSLNIHPFLMQADSAISFKANIKLPSQSISGLLIVKRIDNSSYRTAFITELGMSLFELELKSDTFYVISFIDPLKKHNLIQILARQVFFIVHPFTEKSKPLQSVKRTIINYNFASYGYKCQLDTFNRVTSAEIGNFLSKIRIYYKYSNKHLPVNISLKQIGIRIKWTLKLLEHT